MKKVLSILLVAVMAFSLFGAMAVTASAANAVSFTISNVSVIPSELPGLTNGETYTLTLTPGDAIPANEISAGVALTSGSSTAFTLSQTTKPITATANFGDAPGIFHYVLKQTAGNVPGEVYDKAEYDIFVQYGWNTNQTALEVLNVFCYKAKDKSGNAVSYTYGNNENKVIPQFSNEIPVNEAHITKEVSGNMGELDKDFTFNVKIEYPAATLTAFGNKVYFDYTIYDANNNEVNSAQYASETNAVQIQLKHGYTVKFNNIPSGATITASENSYASDGYTTVANDGGEAVAFTSTAASSGQVCGMKATFPAAEGDKVAAVVYTNTKESVVTGVFDNSLPYIAMSVVAVVAAVAFVMSKKRKIEE